MALNTLFPRGNENEQQLTEQLIIEAIKMHGREFFYIPRTTVAIDKILGEDNLSKFEHAYPIECYMDNIDSFSGNNVFMSKFGMFIEEQAQLTISRQRWEQLIGSQGTSILPQRPAEGDLLYFPLTTGLFEIKFVEHQNPFYQLGRLYVYKLKVELFQYSSERVTTDVDELDQMALDMTFDITGTPTVHATPTKRNYFTNTDLKTEADSGILNFDESNPFGE